MGETNLFHGKMPRLQYCQRFYNRQFHEVTSGKTDLLVRFRKVLEEYYEKKLQIKNGRISNNGIY